MNSKLRSTAAFVALVLGSCSESTAPHAELVDESELTFVRVDPAAPPLIAPEVTVWAVRGEEREARLSYETAGSGYGKCLVLRIPAGAVPAGVAPGDSVQITVRLLDPATFRFAFEPAGLALDPAYPATLEISYRWADRDLDGDGDVDTRDVLLLRTMGIWEKVGPDPLWQRVDGAERRTEQLEIVVPLLGFKQYALATD